MRLRVLGPTVLIADDGPVRLAAKPRALLTILALRRGDVVSADELLDSLWGEALPESSAKLLQVYVSQVRKVLPAAVAIHTRGRGYALEMHPADLDAFVFERSVADGRAELRAGNAALAASILRRALELWHGPALADVRDEPWARGESERLDGLRDLALESRVEADLRLGRHAEVLAELRGLVAGDPTRERLVALAMLAAYRSGAPAEALTMWQASAVALRDELGEAPGTELRSLRERIRRRDPELDLPAAPLAAVVPSLPAPPNELVGRERDLEQLAALLGRPAVRFVSLTGAGGSGKSRLALALAHALTRDHADGAAFVELASLSDPELVMARVAHTLRIEPGIDAEAALAQELASRELLLVLDNLEHLRDAGPAVVRLLAAAPRLQVVVTSRVVLHVSGEHVFPVAPLSPAESAELFAARAAALDPGFALDATTAPLVANICARLDGLPLAIELAAARVRGLGLHGVRDRLASRLALLTGGPRDLPARQQTLAETIAWSVNLLRPADAAVFARLGVFPAGCAPDAAAIVAGATDESVEALLDHHLISADETHLERRLRMLETVREFALEWLGDERPTAEAALVAWATALVAGIGLNDAQRQAASLALLDREIDACREALRIAARYDDPAAELGLAGGLWRYWWIRGALAEGRAVLEGIIERRGVAPTRAGALVVRAAASLAWSMGDRERAETLASAALDAADRSGTPVDTAAARNLLGVLATARGDHDAARAALTEAIDIAERAGLLSDAISSRINLGITDLEAGQLDAARSTFEQVLAWREAEGSVEGIANARFNLGETELEAGNLDSAHDHYRGAADGYATIGFHTRHGNALQGLAAVESRRGRFEDAARRLGRAAALLGPAGWGADGTGSAAGAEAAARAALGDDGFERLFEEGRLAG
jgi:predicted ATPase/DNA-binding SARP family transcriptional activator